VTSCRCRHQSLPLLLLESQHQCVPLLLLER
jgi:hypothetical protein